MLTTPGPSRAESPPADESGGPRPLAANTRPHFRSIICISCCIMNSLLGGSINVFSLYAPVLMRDMNLQQHHVTAISTSAMMSVYFLIPVWGRLCQATSPGLLSFLGGVLFGSSYLAIALLIEPHEGSTSYYQGSPFIPLLLAYTLIGAATSSVLMSSIAACTATLQKSRYRGILCAAPVACFGLSGVLESQVAVRLFSQPSTGLVGREVDLVSFSVLLAGAQFSTGMLGAWGLKTPKPESDEPRYPHGAREGRSTIYGSIGPSRPDPYDSTPCLPDQEAFPSRARGESPLVALVRDPVLWWLSAANLLIMGPTEVYNMNLGTFLQAATGADSVADQVSQHVAILAIISTLARLSAGTLWDRFGSATYRQRATATIVHSRFLVFLFPAAVDVVGFLALASLTDKFPRTISFASACIGLSYASSLSLLPVILLIWGPQQFPLAWGIVSLTPAVGIAAFGWLYSAAYQHAVEAGHESAGRCVGSSCYASWAMLCALGVGTSVVCVLIGWSILKKKSIHV